MSAFFSIALAWKTVNIETPQEIWALMGISVASTTGAVIIKGTKAGQQPDNTKLTGRPLVAEKDRQGVLKKNPEVKDSKLANMVAGEELTDHDYIDITKVQNLFFTVAMVVGYGRMLWFVSLQGDEGIKFPMLSGSMVTILGISHAGYLVSKAAPKTPTK